MVNEVKTEQEFEQILKLENVVIDFSAAWCGPCKLMAPKVEEFSEAVKNKVVVAKIDVDKFQNIAINYGVNSIPTFIYFKNGKEVHRCVGIQSKDILVDKAKNYLG